MAKKKKIEKLFDPDIVPENHAGKKIVDQKALEKVLSLMDTYDKQRCYEQGGLEVNVTDRWDELYRLYKAIYDRQDHNYDGVAEVILPVARRSVNVIESESSNALFSREDYFSVDSIGDDRVNQDMARRAFQILKYYSDNNDYVDEFELALKQCLIYGATVVETIFEKEQYQGVYRTLVPTPRINDATGEPEVNQAGEPIMQKNYKIIQVEDVIDKPKVVARDIYRLYVNINATDPEQEDIIYRDAMSSQTLLMKAEQGIYDATAVKELLKMSPQWEGKAWGNTQSQGEGKTFLSTGRNNDKEDQKYEILRFQGNFTIENEDNGEKIQEQFWIDIGERKVVLRVQENPILSKPKTFSMTNYDTMIAEFYTDGVIDPIKALQYEIDDKENQSLDGLSFDLNAPWLKLKESGIKDSDIMESREMPNKVLCSRVPNGVQKVVNPINLAHLNGELGRLNQYVDIVTGATSLTGGTPTGTQADRSGKALSILQGQAKSQFSKFIRKFERRLLQRSLQKCWQMIMQFVEDTIEIELLGENKERSPYQQKVSEIIGSFNIRVAGGSEYLKEREYRESILEWISIITSMDQFFNATDIIPLLEDIAKAMPRDMSKYVNPENLYAQQRAQIQQMQQVNQQLQQQLQMLGGEVKRMAGELQQTQRSNAVPSMVTNTMKSNDNARSI